ncbi:MAG: serine hydrolase domain-containing protein [Longimicrobiales bacterium]|nr:serine hydrolase domain-containing protein [Longimicrobiales bacterium]
MPSTSLRLRTAALGLAALILFPAGPARAQEARTLRSGQVLSATLESDGAHEYAVTLDAGLFVLGRADQVSADVVVTVLDPQGDRVAAFDASPRGPDVFQFETKDAGTYTLRVTPFEDEAGDYSVELLRVEPVAAEPSGRVDQMMAAYDGPGVPGVVVGVIREGKLVFSRGYGMANLSHGIPFTAETASNIGSVTKHFTAMGILLLAQDGKLSLDDDVREHIPELKDFGTPITLKHLLNHTGGYREIYNLLPMTGRQPEDMIRRDEAIRVVQRQAELQAAPNTEFNYNNTGYILLATVIERVSGQTFPDFMRERVFEPLGMDHTRVKYVQGEIIPGSAQGYVPGDEGGYRQVRDLGGSAGAGGIYTTAADMARWMANWKDGTVGGAAAYAAMTTPAVLAGGDTTGYGLGMSVTKIGGRTLYTHTGGDIAHRTYFGYLPELEAGVWISSNNAAFSLGVGSRVIRAFFGDDLEPETTAAAQAAEDPAQGAGMSGERMEAVTGSWMADAIGLRIEVSLEDGELYAEPTGQGRLPLVVTSDSTASPEGVEATLVWHFEADGTVDTATLVQGQSIALRRIEAEPLTREALEAFTGRFFSDELELGVEVSATEEGSLSVELPTGDRVELTHAEGDAFAGPFPYANVAFQRGEDGSITAFSAANGRTKGVLFRRW